MNGYQFRDTIPMTSAQSSDYLMTDHTTDDGSSGGPDRGLLPQGGLVVSSKVRIPSSELRLTFARSSGPGGQHVNKVSTKAVLRWNVRESASIAEDVRQRFVETFPTRMTGSGEVVLSSDRFRSRKRNAGECVARLRGMLAQVLRPPRKRKATRPSRAAIERRLTAKRHHGEKKRRRRRPPELD